MVDLTKGDAVTVDDEPLNVRNPTMYYFAVNKPKGYICSNARQVSMQPPHWGARAARSAAAYHDGK